MNRAHPFTRQKIAKQANRSSQRLPLISCLVLIVSALMGCQSEGRFAANYHALNPIASPKAFESKANRSLTTEPTIIYLKNQAEEISHTQHMYFPNATAIGWSRFMWYSNQLTPKPPSKLAQQNQANIVLIKTKHAHTPKSTHPIFAPNNSTESASNQKCDEDRHTTSYHERLVERNKTEEEKKQDRKDKKSESKCIKNHFKTVATSGYEYTALFLYIPPDELNNCLDHFNQRYLVK